MKDKSEVEHNIIIIKKPSEVLAPKGFFIYISFLRMLPSLNRLTELRHGG